MRKIYLLSGLGADRRVFDFLDLNKYELECIQWIPPIQNESIEHYAQRLCTQVKTEDPILLGVSFGGMVAIEMSKFIKTDRIVIISSAATKNDIPIYSRILGFLKITSIIPSGILTHPNTFLCWLFGISRQADKDFFNDVLRDSDPELMRWSLNELCNWRNTYRPDNLVQVHGCSDRIFRLNQECHRVERAGHFMIVNRAREVSHLVKNILAW